MHGEKIMASGNSGSSTSLADPDWLVGSFSRRQLIAALWIGSVGLLILGLQPILLGAMFAEGRVSLDELAVMATAEILAIAIGSAIASLLVSTRRLTMKSVVLLIALAVLNCAMSYATSAVGLTIVRSLAGLVEGAMVAVSIELIARSIHAERLGGFFVTLQTLAQSLVALVLARWIVPMAGSSGGFLLLAAVCVASIAVAFALPAEYGDLPRQPQGTDGVLTVKSILCLLSIFAFFLCIGALWAFLEPLGARYGIDGQTVGFIVSASLAVQVVGAVAATWATDRMTYRSALLGCGAVAIAASAVIAGNPSPALFWAASLAIGFVWMFIIPFQVGMAVAADQTRSTALLVPAANLIGAGLGPLVASIFIVGNDVGPVPYFGIGAIVASIALVVLFRALARRPVPA